ncbi:hypothetical protein J5751_02690 [bacterium]|nr:hypothetical protein [bacterium]
MIVLCSHGISLDQNSKITSCSESVESVDSIHCSHSFNSVDFMASIIFALELSVTTFTASSLITTSHHFLIYHISN